MFQRMLLRKYEKIAETLVVKAIALFAKHKQHYQDDKDTLWACLVEMLGLDEANVASEKRDNIKHKYLGCIQGLVYFVGLNDFLKGAMKMRCAQFVGYVDHYCARNAVPPCSPDMKNSLLTALDLDDLYQTHPELFTYAPA